MPSLIKQFLKEVVSLSEGTKGQLILLNEKAAIFIFGSSLLAVHFSEPQDMCQ